ncbi:PREDICTED: uncharacterized protein LOC104807388 [Tarenaya hassleriana]|uniref:uncharacterized protein LOC104807388 n=1 Tax=Tarenaya hassleriana TaxID=28532 RepID=UPI00053CA4A0|nr:PREDICTED: uncharacterized protein LOC104807388 [Tarenaya hassleriana]
MAAFHVRSNSLPSNPNPLSVLQVDEHLTRLRSSNTASTSSSPSTCRNLNHLHDLLECINKMTLQQSVHRQALSGEQNMTTVEELLDGSLRLLDVCGVAKDALSSTKECLRDLQSAIRRKSDGFLTEVKKYLACRKSLKKSFQNVSKSLKTRDSKREEDETMAILREAEAATAEVLASVLCFVSGSKSLSKPSGKWSLVSKLVSQKRAGSEKEEENSGNEFMGVDSALVSLARTKSEKGMRMEDLQRLEMSIEDVEKGLQCVFRSLIELRVSVLNVLAN